MTALDAARKWAAENAPDGPLYSVHAALVEAFMSGAAFQSAEAARVLDGVVRARSRDPDGSSCSVCGKGSCPGRCEGNARAADRDASFRANRWGDGS